MIPMGMAEQQMQVDALYALLFHIAGELEAQVTNTCARIDHDISFAALD
jgi:hypothetical protein